MAAMPEGHIYTVQQLAEFLQVDQVTIRTLLREGKLVGFRVGKQWRITREALAVFMDTRPSPEDLAEDDNDAV